jgi:hypothetical protein
MTTIPEQARELLADALSAKFGGYAEDIAIDLVEDPADWQKACLGAIEAALLAGDRQTLERAAKVAKEWNPGRRDRITEEGIAEAILNLAPSQAVTEVGRRNVKARIKQAMQNGRRT